MGKASIILACATVAAILAGCREPVQVASLKDHAPKPALSSGHETKPAVLATERPSGDVSVFDRAKSEQSVTCGQRHVDHHGGRLHETQEQKQLADTICAELHRYDHVR